MYRQLYSGFMVVAKDTNMNEENRPASDSLSLLESKGIQTDDEDDDDIHFCKKCQEVFKSIEAYLEHKVKHDNYKVVYSRSNKNKRVIFPKLIQKERKLNQSNENVEASSKVKVKDEEEEEKKKLKKKLDTTSADIFERNSYTCTECGKKFNREATLRWHVKYDHKPKDEDDEEDEREEEEEPEYIPAKVIENDEIINIVKSSDAKRQKLSEEELSLRPFVCDICGNRFRDFQVLKVHQLTHSNRRDFMCTYEGCEYSFKTKGSLKRHLRRHTGERPYECPKCKRKFTESGALTRHIKSRNPCTEKTDADFPRYGKQWKPEQNISAKVGAVQQVIKTEEGNTSEIQLDLNSDQIDGDSQIVGGNETIHAEIVTDNGDGSLNTVRMISLDNLESEEENLEPTQCKVCKEDFGNYDNLKEHLRIHLADMTYRCSLCHFITEKMEELDSHMITVHQTPPKPQSYVPKKENSSVESTAVPPTIDKRQAQIAVRQLLEIPGALDPECSTEAGEARNAYKCPACERTFRGSSYLKHHMKSHAGVKPNKCSVCGKCFTTKDALTKHLTVHSDDRQYKCGECGRLFKRISHIREHLKTHSTERPHVCKICNKGFKTPNAVKVHQRTHNNILPYQCRFCDRFFREKSSLQRHIRMHTGERPYKCVHCNRGFSEHGTLNRHLKAKVPCTKHLYLSRKDGILENVPGEDQNISTVLTEFSSVVADTQQYILPDGSETLDISGTEYVVVHTDMESTENVENLVTEIVTDGEIDSTILDQLTNEGSYVVVNEQSNHMRIIDSSTGATIALMPENVTLTASENEIEAVAMAPISESDAIQEAMLVANVVDAPTDISVRQDE